jgi:O-antigen ligase
MIQLPLKQKLFYFFPVLFCFCLPFGSLVLSGIVVLWTVVSFFNLNKIRLREGFLSRHLLLFYSFFILTVISAVLSSNTREALFAIEIKLSFILFPYFMFCFPWPLQILKRCVVSFVSGCFFACLYLIIRAFLYAYNGQPEYFFYTLFSDFIHASYFAMYLMLAITFVLLLYDKWFRTHKSVIYSSYFFIAIFITTIFLCSSKMGLISFFICFGALLLYKWRRVLSFRNVTIALFCATLAVILLVFLLPDSFNRLQSLSAVSNGNIDKTSAESTTVRILIWEQALGIIRDNFLFGTGVGDANDQLYIAYEANGITGALSHKLNAHNQYLQTFIGMGLIGFFLFLLILLNGLIISFRKRHVFFFLFITLTAMHFSVESMLQRSDGILFFAFFYCFFCLTNEEKLLNEQVAALE